MKKMILTSASILALSMAGPALAQVVNNDSEIEQAGNNALASVNQSGTGNESDVVQNGGTGTFTSGPNAGRSVVATVNQAGTDGTSKIAQDGDRNAASLTQTSASDGMRSEISQERNRNTATVIQRGTSDGTTINSIVEQTGTQGVAYVEQDSATDGATSSVTQTGGDQRASVIQTSGAADSTVVQNGGAQNASVFQDGSSRSNIEQSNRFNEASVRQQGGDGNQSDVFQTGVNGDAGDPDNIYGSADALTLVGVLQNGNNNVSMINQSGDNQTALVNQMGDRNRSDIDQDGNYADATVIQDGDENEADVRFQAADGSGTGGPATPVVPGINASAGIYQTGDLNDALVEQYVDALPATAIIDQNGNENDSKVYQREGDAFASNTQNGSFNDSIIDQTGGTSSATVIQTASGLVPGAPRTDQPDPLGLEAAVRSNFSRVMQNGLGTNIAKVTQNGTGNRSEVEQRADGGTASATVEQTNIFNNSAVRQTAAATANVTQGGTYGDNFSFVDQSADGATAIVKQFGNGTTDNAAFPTNESTIMQADAALADVRQTGSQNESTINQNVGSNGALAKVVQETSPAAIGSNDPKNTSLITQSATTSAFVEQIGQRNASKVSQAGENTAPGNGLTYAVEVSQFGQAGRSTVLQGPGSGNEASVTQTAGSDRADSFISQTGSDNFADVTQGGVNNESDILQSGNSNTATVMQTSDSNYSNVNQSGNGNTATVTQGF